MYVSVHSTSIFGIYDPKMTCTHILQCNPTSVGLTQAGSNNLVEQLRFVLILVKNRCLGHLWGKKAEKQHLYSTITTVGVLSHIPVANGCLLLKKFNSSYSSSVCHYEILSDFSGEVPFSNLELRIVTIWMQMLQQVQKQLTQWLKTTTEYRLIRFFTVVFIVTLLLLHEFIIRDSSILSVSVPTRITLRATFHKTLLSKDIWWRKKLNNYLSAPL